MHRRSLHFVRRSLFVCLFFSSLVQAQSSLIEINPCQNSHFESKRIQINNIEIDVELAVTPSQRREGLMNRTDLAEGKGMLFIFETPQILSFWMKDTKIALSIAFFDEKCCLINIEHMNPTNAESLPVYQSKKPALYALEVPQGWFERHQIVPSMKLKRAGF